MSRERNGGKGSFAWALFRTFYKYYAIAGIFCLMEYSARIVSTLLFRHLINLLSAASKVENAALFGPTLWLALAIVVQVYAGPQIVFRYNRCQSRWTSATCNLIYGKLLRLSSKALRDVSTGQVVQLVSADAERFNWMVFHLHMLWLGPLVALVVLVILYRDFGVPALVGYFLLVLVLIIQLLLGTLNGKYKLKMVQASDKRVGLISEIIHGIKLIKMYCWDKPFCDIVLKIRGTELGHLWRLFVTSSVSSELYIFSYRLLSATVVLVHYFTQQQVPLVKIFPMFVLFNIVNEALLVNMTWGIRTIVESKVSIRRIENFLKQDEISKENKRYRRTVNQASEISVVDVSAKWDMNIPRATLKNLNFTVIGSELIAVVGPVGAGKSSLLMGLLGELKSLTGTISVRGSVAYAAQQPWIFSSTIRQNILFGTNMDRERYKAAISVTALAKDLEEFTHGDLTRVGDRGINLSGGQKARVGLARAVHHNADIYLLDDPLSAVDATVGKHIFEECIVKMLSNKLRILVTHQLQYLEKADRIIIMNEGAIVSIGSCAELIKSGLDFAKLLNEGVHEEKEEKPGVQRLMSGEKSLTESSDKAAGECETEDPEDKEVGTPDLFVWWQYLRAGAGRISLGLLTLTALSYQLMYHLADWWIALWSTSNEDRGAATYIIILCIIFILGFSRSIYFFKVCIQSSTNLHKRMYDAVMRCPMRFFDTNSAGRILNRFSSDMGDIDNYIPDSLTEFLQTLLVVLGSVVTMAIFYPVILLYAVPIAWLLLFIRRRYSQTQSDLLRIESMARSPIFSQLSATINGLQTIRAHLADDLCKNEFGQRYDALTGATFTAYSVYNWFAFRLNAVNGILILMTTISCLSSNSLILSGMAGLMLSYVFPMMWTTQDAIRLGSEVEMMMTHTERVLHYTKLSSEAPLEGSVQPPKKWPHSGAVVFRDVSFSYWPGGPSVLRNLNLAILPAEKIGIVGRTGSGKSSLMNAVFRIAEPSGKILIDGIDIQEIGLHDLRNTLAIIPQISLLDFKTGIENHVIDLVAIDWYLPVPATRRHCQGNSLMPADTYLYFHILDPVFFSGTVRSNLDPFGAYLDADVWMSLNQVQMGDVIRQLPLGLQHAVSEGGSNFSTGQKQLLCLARAILKDSKILLIDEATANVDRSTDILIQTTIKTRFKHCTVLTIAHRLDTIMDSDRILVMEDGEIVECGKPFLLLQKSNGFLYRMVSSAGIDERNRLVQLAKTAFGNSTGQRIHSHHVESFPA